MEKQLSQEPEQEPKGNMVGKNIPIIGVLLLLGAGFYFSLSAGPTTSLQANLNNPSVNNSSQQTQQAMEDKKVLDQLKKIILLPENITPTMGIITDVEILKKQQPGFFANAKNGERLIVYPDLAIIFDPETNKIIKTGGILVDAKGTKGK